MSDTAPTARFCFSLNWRRHLYICHIHIPRLHTNIGSYTSLLKFKYHKNALIGHICLHWMRLMKKYHFLSSRTIYKENPSCGSIDVYYLVLPKIWLTEFKFLIPYLIEITTHYTISMFQNNVLRMMHFTAILQWNYSYTAACIHSIRNFKQWSFHSVALHWLFS